MEDNQNNVRERIPEEIDFNFYRFAVLDQIKAADYTLEAIKEVNNLLSLDPSLNAVKETDVFRLRRGLCLPCASASCINWVAKTRIVDDDKGTIRVGDIYKILLPFHGRKEFAEAHSFKLEKGWLFATPEGDVYHQAILAFSKGLGIPALSVEGFDSIAEFASLLKNGGAAAISLDNRFVLDHTLGRNGELAQRIDGKWKILIDGSDGLEFRDFEEGRHVVSVLDIAEDGSVIILDSFRLPQMSEESVILKLPMQEVDKYLDYSTGDVSRGILFARKRDTLSPWEVQAPSIVVPDEIVETVKKKLNLISFR